MERRLELLRQSLLEQRDRYNTLYALARRVRPLLDSTRFSHNLEHYLAGLLVDGVSPGTLVENLYEIVLELTGLELFERSEGIQTLWKEVLPRHAHFLASEPARGVASLSNAVYNLESEAADWRFWLKRMDEVAADCSDLDSWLRAGQVLAWVSGMAHYQESALSLAGALPEQMMSSLIPRWDKVQSDPWWPRRRQLGEVSQVYKVGGFVGFGGQFSKPPEVVAAGPERFLVSDGGSDWLLFCDGFGATIKRVRDFQLQESEVPEVSVTQDGSLKWDGESYAFPFLEPVSSFAASGQVVAVTSALSHCVYLFLGPG